MKQGENVFSVNPSKGLMSTEWVCSLLEEKQLFLDVTPNVS